MGKNFQKLVEFLLQSTNIPLYLPLPNSLSIPNSETERTPDTYTHTCTHTRAHTRSRVFAQKASPTENSTEAATTVWIPVYTSLYTNAGILVRVGGTRQRLSPRCDTGAGGGGWLAEGA